MSFHIEGERPGTGNLEGMEIRPIVVVSESDERMQNFLRYKALVDKKYELSEKKDRAILRPWLWGRIPRLNMKLTVIARKIKEARTKLPL